MFKDMKFPLVARSNPCPGATTRDHTLYVGYKVLNTFITASFMAATRILLHPDVGDLAAVSGGVCLPRASA